MPGIIIATKGIGATTKVRGDFAASCGPLARSNITAIVFVFNSAQDIFQIGLFSLGLVADILFLLQHITHGSAMAQGRTTLTSIGCNFTFRRQLGAVFGHFLTHLILQLGQISQLLLILFSHLLQLLNSALLSRFSSLIFSKLLLLGFVLNGKMSQYANGNRYHYQKGCQATYSILQMGFLNMGFGDMGAICRNQPEGKMGVSMPGFLAHCIAMIQAVRQIQRVSIGTTNNSLHISAHSAHKHSPL